MPEQVLPKWIPALQLGKLNENVVTHEFDYQGIPVQRTQGKHDFDFYLPDGRSCEVKLDLRSQATNYALIEQPTFDRSADIHIHTLTYAVVLTHTQLEKIYRQGKIVQAGDNLYNSRAIPKYLFKDNSMYLDTFINSLK